MQFPPRAASAVAMKFLILLPRPGVALAALTAALCGCGRGPATPAAPLPVLFEPALPLDQAPMRNIQTYIASIRGDKETDLGFKVNGLLELIGDPLQTKDWEEGVSVAKGSMLARLKQSDFTNNVRQAQAKADLDASLLANNRQLIKDQAISKQELEIIEANQKGSAAALEKARQELADSVLLAPFDGVILARFANSGETVLAGRPVIRFADLSSVSVELGVPDRLVGRISKDDQIPLRISAFEGTTFNGRVSEVGVAAKEGGRLFKVVIKVDNRERLIRPGMTASVTFEDPLVTHTNAVVVPLSALVAASHHGQSPAEPNQLSVFLVGRDERLHEQWVQTDQIIRSSVIVTRGLRAGDRVVVAGATMLYEGARVEARRAERPQPR